MIRPGKDQKENLRHFPEKEIYATSFGGSMDINMYIEYTVYTVYTCTVYIFIYIYIYFFFSH